MRLVLLGQVYEQVIVDPDPSEVICCLRRLDEDDGCLFLEKSEQEWLFTDGEHVEYLDTSGRYLLSGGFAEPAVVQNVLLAFLQEKPDWKSESGTWREIPDEHVC